MEIIAHRGASAYALENSRQALELAWRMGADRVEIDVQATRDGKPLVLHDPLLDRTTTGHGTVSQLMWDELQEVRLHNGEPLLTLDEALEWLRGRTSVYIDLKDPRALGGVIESLKSKGLEEDAIIGSTDPAVLIRIRQLAPEIKTSLLVRETDERVVLSAAEQKIQFVHLCWEHHPNPLRYLTPMFLYRVKEAGLEVILWHEEREKMLRRIVEMKQLIYGVCTNTPDRACRILKGL